VGWGDELMAAGEARRIHEATGGKVRIVAHPTARTTLSSVLWDNIDYIAKPGETAVATLVESPFVRPYRARLGRTDPAGSPTGRSPPRYASRRRRRRFRRRWDQGSY
jgi:hypothetical protein